MFNGARFLGEAIESVLGQRGNGVEIIVVDDGSIDTTKDVACGFGVHVTYLHQANAGVASARNRGIEHASRAFVALLDADDLWCPGKTTLQLARFAARPELTICTGQMENFWSSEVAHEELALQDDLLTQAQPNLGSSFMARRSVFETAGMLDISFKHRDIQEFVLRATNRGAIVEAMPDVLVKRRIHDANMSRDRNAEGDLELLAIARARMARRRGSGA